MGSHCIQIEMITYVGDTLNRPGNRGRLPAPLLEAVADVVRVLATEIPELDIDSSPEPARWRPSGGFGLNAPQRFSDKEWERFNGICGHQHVPHNTHWDPGGFDIEGLVGLVKGTSNGAMTLVEAQTGWPTFIGQSDRCPEVRIIRAVLQGLGYGTLGKSELFSEKVGLAVRKLQEAEAITVDGIWGPETHRHAEGRIATELSRG